MALYRAFATVGAMTIWSRILGFIRDVLIAAVLGAGPVADAFFVAFRVPNLFRRLFAEGRLRRGLHPALRQALSRRAAARRRRAPSPSRPLPGSRLILVVFTLLGEFIMPWLMLLLAPGFADDPAKFALAVLLARIALPFLLCMSLVALYSGVLNALGRFAVAAFAPSLLNVVLIAVLLGADRHRRRRAEHGRGGARLGHRRVGRAAGDRRRRCRGEIEDAPLLPPAALRCRHAQAARACRPWR